MSNHSDIIHKTQHNKYVKHQSIISRNVQYQTTCATPLSSFISHFWHQIVTPRTWTIIQKEKKQWMCHAHHALLVQTVTWRSKGQEYAQPSRTHYTACPENVWLSHSCMFYNASMFIERYNKNNNNISVLQCRSLLPESSGQISVRDSNTKCVQFEIRFYKKAELMLKMCTTSVCNLRLHTKNIRQMAARLFSFRATIWGFKGNVHTSSIDHWKACSC